MLKGVPLQLVFVAGAAAIGVGLSLRWGPRRRARRQLLELFGLDAREWRPVGSDLHGRALPAKKLSANGVAGVPDAVFIHRRERRVLIAELKNRAGTSPSLYERYQLVLYQGLAAARYPKHTPEGLIRYEDRCALVPFEPELYDALTGLRGEYQRARKRKRPLDPRPLTARIRADGASPEGARHVST